MDPCLVSETENKLIREIATILCVEPSTIRPDISLPALGLDSMGFVELLVFIEKTFNLRLMESGLAREDFETVRALAARISKGSGA